MNDQTTGEWTVEHRLLGKLSYSQACELADAHNTALTAERERRKHELHELESEHELANGLLRGQLATTERKYLDMERRHRESERQLSAQREKVTLATQMVQIESKRANEAEQKVQKLEERLRSMNTKERFDSRWTPEPFSGCWLWIGAEAFAKGYGRFSLNGVVQLAHRVAWQIYKGEIPDGLCVLHDCDTPACVNPDHLHTGTIKDNAIEAVQRGHWVNINGERNGNAVLTNEQVTDIRNIRGVSNKKIARRFGVSPSVIDKVRNGASWKHLL